MSNLTMWLLLSRINMTSFQISKHGLVCIVSHTFNMSFLQPTFCGPFCGRPMEYQRGNDKNYQQSTTAKTDILRTFSCPVEELIYIASIDDDWGVKQQIKQNREPQDLKKKILTQTLDVKEMTIQDLKNRSSLSRIFKATLYMDFFSVYRICNPPPPHTHTHFPTLAHILRQTTP